MEHKWFPVVTGVVAVGMWGALGVVLNTRFPTTGNQVLLVAIVAGALAATVMLASYLLQTRQHGSLHMTPPWRNAVRHGAIVGVLGAVLLGLRLVGSLGIASGVILVLLAGSCELLAWLRRRY